MATQKRRLGEILVTSGEITQSQLDQALAEQKTNGKRLGETLISLNFLTERKMLKTLEKQLSIPYMFLSDIEIMPEAVAAVPIFLAERYTLVPLKKDGNRLTIAMNDPTNFYAIDDVRMVSGCDISIVLSEQQDIINAINNFYGVSGRVGGSLNKLKEDSFAPVIRRVEDSSEDAPIIKIVNSVIEQAVRDKASDIHIEPQEDDTRVRFRVDGVLRNAVTLPKNSHSAIISRIKIMAEMDIAEKRLPQDGRINIEQGGRDIDLRISTLPTILGEKVVMRILDKTAASIDINDLAFTAKNMELYSSLFNSSYGIVLVTGPTGSGKSTTLYSTLTNINNPNKNIITVEDPVEYRIEGVNQVAVNNKAGLTFANGLRSILRQDPNIIMVGEIRVLTQNTAQSVGKGKARFIIDSYLIDAFNTIFDRIFNSNDVFIRIVDIGERRVQSCRFAAAGRTCDKYDAIGRVEQTAIQLHILRCESQIIDINRSRRFIKNTHNNLFT